MNTDLLGLFLSAFISSTLFPGGSEALLVYLYLQDSQHASTLISVATLGNTLGAMTSWGIGRYLVWRFPAQSLLEKRRRAIEQLRRFGSVLLLLSWLPIIGDPLCVAAGWLRIHWLKALLFISLGKLLRYWFVLELARRAL